MRVAKGLLITLDRGAIGEPGGCDRPACKAHEALMRCEVSPWCEATLIL